MTLSLSLLRLRQEDHNKFESHTHTGAHTHTQCTHSCTRECSYMEVLPRVTICLGLIQLVSGSLLGPFTGLQGDSGSASVNPNASSLL